MRATNVTSRFFNGNMTADEMKAKYRKLVREFHPDLNPGIDDSTIKQVTCEYAYWYARAATTQVKEEKKQSKPQSTEYYENHYSTGFADNLESMINWIYSQNLDRIDGITVELIGVFIWIGGIKVEHNAERTAIKGMGFQGGWKITDAGESVYMWKWTPEIKRFGSERNMDTIRKNHGARDVRRGTNQSYARKQIAG